MKQTAFLFVIAAAGAAGFIGMYQEWYIPSSKALLIITVMLGIVYMATVLRRTGSKKRMSLLLLTLSLFLVQTAGAWIYEIWTFETFFSAAGMMKISMILFGTGALVLNTIHFISRATHKKRSIQRTAKREKNNSARQLFKRKAAEKTVTVVLGESVHVK